MASRRGFVALALALCWLLGGGTLGSAESARADSESWSIHLSPVILTEDVATAVEVTVTPGDKDVGCIAIDIPSGFDVVAASIISVPAGAVWTASVVGSGPTLVVFCTTKDSWRLKDDRIGVFRDPGDRQEKPARRLGGQRLREVHARSRQAHRRARSAPRPVHHPPCTDAGADTDADADTDALADAEAHARARADPDPEAHARADPETHARTDPDVDPEAGIHAVAHGRARPLFDTPAGLDGHSVYRPFVLAATGPRERFAGDARTHGVADLGSRRRGLRLTPPGWRRLCPR